ALFLLCATLATIECRPQLLNFANNALQAVPRILNFNSENSPRGFAFDVDTSDGFHHDARGELKSDTGREEDEGIEVEGSYMYIGDDGKLYRVDYTAGKEGFRPAGTHLVPSAGVKKLGVGDSASASLAGTGLG
ncbi:hypothetical protein NQ315_007133, partial [Exocentrus adspersus]